MFIYFSASLFYLTQYGWFHFQMDKWTANRRFSDRRDKQKETLQIIFFDTEQPKGFKNADVFREKRKREVDLFASLSDSFRNCTIKFRDLAFDVTGSIFPGEMIVVRRWIYYPELSEICDNGNSRLCLYSMKYNIYFTWDPPIPITSSSITLVPSGRELSSGW